MLCERAFFGFSSSQAVCVATLLSEFVNVMEPNISVNVSMVLILICFLLVVQSRWCGVRLGMCVRCGLLWMVLCRTFFSVKRMVNSIYDIFFKVYRQKYSAVYTCCNTINSAKKFKKILLLINRSHQTDCDTCIHNDTNNS